MDREQIKRLALDSGFKLKTQADGSEDLNEYVYAFAAALLDCRPAVKVKLPLKPLKWSVSRHSRSAFHDYIITLDKEARKNSKAKYVVEYCRLSGGYSFNIATGFSDIEEAKEWAWNHYNEKMRDWVYSLEEIKKELVK